jgi:hypothetical protein
MHDGEFLGRWPILVGIMNEPGPLSGHVDAASVKIGDSFNINVETVNQIHSHFETRSTPDISEFSK